MHTWASWLLFLAALGHTARGDMTSSDCNNSQAESSAHDFQALSLDESRNVSLSDYAGKVLIVVNTATF